MQTKLVQLSAKPNFLAIKAKGPDYAKNMKVISAKLNSLTVDEIKDLQAGNSIKLDFGEVGADCLMLNRIVADGMAVEADQHFTVALDLKITDELRRACVARELVNRIHNPARREQRPRLRGHCRAEGNTMRSMKTAVRTRTTPSPTRRKRSPSSGLPMASKPTTLMERLSASRRLKPKYSQKDSKNTLSLRKGVFFIWSLV